MLISRLLRGTYEMNSFSFQSKLKTKDMRKGGHRLRVEALATTVDCFIHTITAGEFAFVSFAHIHLFSFTCHARLIFASREPLHLLTIKRQTLDFGLDSGVLCLGSFAVRPLTWDPSN